MTHLEITLDRALALRDRGALLVDARSPAEYAEATIPGAINVPILDNIERAEVGTLYKQVGRQAARQRGVEFVAPKIPRLLAQIEACRPTGMPVVVFCWRGGMRSKALTQFLELAGIPARQLKGGHKVFRSLVCDFFARGEWGRLLVLRGLTGVGKTALLHRLAGEGYPVLDLEGLANHRGSAFGHLGLLPQPTQRMFEALLWDVLRGIPPGGYAVTEGESRHIGRVALPLQLYQALQIEVSIWIEAPLETRIRNILADYPARDSLREQFAAPLRALKERCGRQTVEEMLALLGRGAWAELVRELMLRYYDPLYHHTFPARRIEVAIESESTGVPRLKAAIAAILAAPPESGPHDKIA